MLDLVLFDLQLGLFHQLFLLWLCINLSTLSEVILEHPPVFLFKLVFLLDLLALVDIQTVDTVVDVSEMVLLEELEFI